jgi:hypothetical protein
MDAQEGGGVTLGIVLVERESVIVRDLPAQSFTVGRGLGLMAHPSRYASGLASGASCLSRVPPELQASRSGRLNRLGSR